MILAVLEVCYILAVCQGCVFTADLTSLFSLGSVMYIRVELWSAQFCELLIDCSLFSAVARIALSVHFQEPGGPYAQRSGVRLFTFSASEDSVHVECFCF